MDQSPWNGITSKWLDPPMDQAERAAPRSHESARLVLCDARFF
jgi:hypothetical protein